MSHDSGLNNQLRQMIVERLFLSIAASEVKDDADLMQTYGIDSVNLFEIIVGLEDEFGIIVEDEDFSVEAFATVSSIAELVRRKRGEST